MDIRYPNEVLPTHRGFSQFQNLASLAHSQYQTSAPSLGFSGSSTGRPHPKVIMESGKWWSDGKPADFGATFFGDQVEVAGSSRISGDRNHQEWDGSNSGVQKSLETRLHSDIRSTISESVVVQLLTNHYSFGKIPWWLNFRMFNVFQLLDCNPGEVSHTWPQGWRSPCPICPPLSHELCPSLDAWTNLTAGNSHCNNLWEWSSSWWLKAPKHKGLMGTSING